jgi:4'-phosphopantetheinyl transferase
LRDLLGRYLDEDPRGIVFTSSAEGKPRLRGAGRESIDFNMSHSAAVALYAFSAAGPVGVDVESGHVTTGEAAFARRVFGASEEARLKRLPAARRRPELQRLWVRHEASAKLTGAGLGGGRPAAGTWFADLPMEPGISAAIALVREPVKLRCLRFGSPRPSDRQAI